MAQCLTPVIVKNEKRKSNRDFRTNIFPCGKCPNCLKRRVRHWVFRLQEENKISSSSAFLTLTYEDGKLPYSDNGYPTLDRKAFPSFMKRLRKNISDWSSEEQKQNALPIKYYAVGEYGDITARPHYHAIVFNLPTFFMDNPDTLQIVWQNGYVRFDPVNDNTIAYVAGYCEKKLYNTEKVGKDTTDDRVPEFSLMSKKMGLNYLTEGRKKYYKTHLNPFLRVEGGEKISMPRYFKEKIGFTEAEKEKMNEKAIEHLVKNGFKSEKDRIEHTQYQFFKAKKKSKQKRKTL